MGRPMILTGPAFFLAIIIGCSLAEVALGEELPLTSALSVRFASVQEGQAAITRRDAFTENLSTFDLQCRLQTTRDVTVDDLLARYAEHVTAWPDEDIERVSAATAAVGKRLERFNLQQPKLILLVRTTGKEEAGAAYCRGPAIVLPQNMLRQEPAALERLLAHELFHIISTHHDELRRDLYAIVGFHVCPPIEPPAALRDRLITNPDAPQIDAYIRVKLPAGREVLAVPLLVASAEKYDPQSGKSLFDYLQFRLLEVEPAADGTLAPVIADGQPLLHDPRRLPSYHEQIGRNTGYIIHPDEILADNFAHLITGAARLPSPEIVEKMRERMERDVD